MSPRPNVATSQMVTGNDTATETGAETVFGGAGADSLSGEAGGDAYPMLTGKQEGALDRDGDGAPGGAPPGGNKPAEAKTKAAVGEVVRKGAAPAEETRKRMASEPVTVRVTKSGHGKVHDGRGGFYNWNDETVLPYSVAQAQEANTNVEIIG